MSKDVAAKLFNVVQFPVNLTSDNAADLQRIASATGQSLSDVTNEAISRWFEKEGDVVLEAIEQRGATITKKAGVSKGKMLMFVGANIQRA